jgi:hypothetical protein
MYKQTFRYVRLIAKSVGLPFIVAGVLLFILQFLPTYIGKGIWFWIFIIAGFVWGLDTFWSTLKDLIEIAGQIQDHRHPNHK